MARYLRRLSLIVCSFWIGCALQREYTMGQPLKCLWQNDLQKCPVEKFNFRDAKQYWGLEDFMNVKERPVYNSANLALFMVNISHALMRPMRAQWPAFSVTDLKAWFRGRKYVVETLKLLPAMPDAICIEQLESQIAELGRVNHAVNPA